MRTSLARTKELVFSLASQAARQMAACYNRALAPLGITAQQVSALAVLWKEENLSLGEFAHKAGIGKAAAVAMVRRLEAMGLVTSAPHPGDGRKNILFLTEKAKKLKPEVESRLLALERAMESILGDANVRNLVESLKKIRDWDVDRPRPPEREK